MDLVLLERFRWLAYKIKAEGTAYHQNLYFNECGTPFCLAGHGTTDIVLVRAGLFAYAMPKGILSANGRQKVPAFGPPDSPLIGSEALEKLLGINATQTDYIFGAMYEIADADDSDVRTVDFTIDGVINRITRVMEGYLNDD
jgi:hypothetical protein